MLTIPGLGKLILLLLGGAASGAGVAVMLSADDTFLGHDRHRRVLWVGLAICVLADSWLTGTRGLSFTQVITQDGIFLAASYAGYRLMERSLLARFKGS